jgi:SAM-dependent MidA family methyltransferase
LVFLSIALKSQSEVLNKDLDISAHDFSDAFSVCAIVVGNEVLDEGVNVQLFEKGQSLFRGHVVKFKQILGDFAAVLRLYRCKHA